MECARRRRVADPTGERVVYKTVVLAGLIRKAEECKEDKGAQHVRPAFHLETDDDVGIILPHETSDLDDPMIVAVGVFPTDPWCHTHLRIVHNEKRPQRNSEKHFDAGKDHQADVAAPVQTTIGRHYLPELTFALAERIDGQSYGSLAATRKNEGKPGHSPQ
jgi:hypothetical protein